MNLFLMRKKRQSTWSTTRLCPGSATFQSLLQLGVIINKHIIDFHCYADDTHLYMAVVPAGMSPLYPLENLLLNLQMIQNVLRRIYYKKDSDRQKKKCLEFTTLFQHFTSQTKSQRYLYSNLTFQLHMSCLRQSCFYYNQALLWQCTV